MNESPHQLIWRRIIWRQWRREPVVPLVLLLILALGVGVFLAVRLANQAAVTGFALFTESITGDSDLLVRPKSGSFDEDQLYSLRDSLGDTPAIIFPVLEATASDGNAIDARVYRILGSDFVALANAAYHNGNPSPIPEGDSDFSGLGVSDQVYVSEAIAKERELSAGSSFPILIEGKFQNLTVAGILQNAPLLPEIPDNLILLDLPGAQELTGNPGRLSRLEVRVLPGPGYESNLETTRTKLTEWSRDLFVIESPSERKKSCTRMSAAFRLNLTILSSLALIVGAYLVLQAMEASVIRRRSEIAILRCLGVTPSQIRRAWILESLVLGLFGSFLGLGLGFILAQGMVRAIGSTVNTLYYETTSKAAGFDMGEASFAFLFGTVVSVIAGWLPAREASEVPPAHAVTKGARGGGLKILRYPLLGLAITIAAWLAAQLPPLNPAPGKLVPVGGYLAAFLFMIGLSILAGVLFGPISRLLSHRGGSPERLYAASQLRLPEGRHRLAAAGLLVAFGMSAAMGILIASFDTTLNAWIRQMLRADIYIAAAGSQSVVSENRLPASVWQEIVDSPEIDGYDRLRRYSITFEGRDTWLAGADYNTGGRHLQLIWIDTPSDPSPSSLNHDGEGPAPAWISESFSRSFARKTGDIVSVPTPQGSQTVKIAGIYADYGSERGTILVSRQLTSEWFRDDSLNNMAIYLKPGTDAERWLAGMKSRHPEVVARTNAKLRADSLRLFRQTFSVTYALEGIAVIIAVTGLGLAMAGLLLERRNELGTLKELGMTRGGIANAAMWEGIGLSLAGVTGGLVLSLLLGWLLVFVINRQSFGWTLGFTVPWLSFSILAAAMIATGGLVARIVGYRIANLKSDAKINDE